MTSPSAPVARGADIMAFWSVWVTVGDLWVLLVYWAVLNNEVRHSVAQSGLGLTSFQVFFIAGFAFLAALAIGVFAAPTRWRTTTGSPGRNGPEPAGTPEREKTFGWPQPRQLLHSAKTPRAFHSSYAVTRCAHPERDRFTTSGG